MKGVTSFYYAFRQHLRKNAKRIGPLQTVSRLEEYLTKEFCSVVFLKSRNKILPLTNLGLRSDKRRIDISFLKGDMSKILDAESAKELRDKLAISTLIEVKFIRNRHRFGFSEAKDEIATTLKDLRRQLSRFQGKKYAGYQVRHRGRRGDTYGLVAVSYVWRKNRDREPDDPMKFVQDVKEVAEKHFRYHDMSVPYVDRIYEKHRFKILNADFSASLYIGLWRLKE